MYLPLGGDIAFISSLRADIASETMRGALLIRALSGIDSFCYQIDSFCYQMYSIVLQYSMYFLHVLLLYFNVLYIVAYSTYFRCILLSK